VDPLQRERLEAALMAAVCGLILLAAVVVPVWAMFR
jgi:hypothetical protein